MRKRSDTPTRSEVTETVDSHKEEMDDKTVELDTIATDTETVRETLDSLDFSGTSEGTDEVESSIEQAEDVTVEIFEQEDENLEQMQGETEEYENELQERSDSSESDMGKISDAGSKIETPDTVTELDKAREAVANDIEFLDDQNEKAQGAREETEELQQQHRARVQGGKR